LKPRLVEAMRAKGKRKIVVEYGEKQLENGERQEVTAVDGQVAEDGKELEPLEEVDSRNRTGGAEITDTGGDGAASAAATAAATAGGGAATAGVAAAADDDAGSVVELNQFEEMIRMIVLGIGAPLEEEMLLAAQGTRTLGLQVFDEEFDEFVCFDSVDQLLPDYKGKLRLVGLETVKPKVKAPKGSRKKGRGQHQQQQQQQQQQQGQQQGVSEEVDFKSPENRELQTAIITMLRDSR
jgi:hypothetical protein